MTENSNAKASSAGKGTWLMIIGVLLMSITSQAANYGNNLVLPSKLDYFNITNLYSLFATLSGMGMMISLPLVGMLSGKFGVSCPLRHDPSVCYPLHTHVCSQRGIIRSFMGSDGHRIGSVYLSSLHYYGHTRSPGKSSQILWIYCHGLSNRLPCGPRSYGCRD